MTNPRANREYILSGNFQELDKLYATIERNNKNTAIYKELLQRAADKLQDYCSELNGDLNDSLSSEIENVLKKN